jgi:hypothetical protein
MVGKPVTKVSRKPFKSGLAVNTVSGIVPFPYDAPGRTGQPAFTFVEDDSIVLCTTCYPAELTYEQAKAENDRLAAIAKNHDMGASLSENKTSKEIMMITDPVDGHEGDGEGQSPTNENENGAAGQNPDGELPEGGAGNAGNAGEPVAAADAPVMGEGEAEAEAEVGDDDRHQDEQQPEEGAG